MSKNIIDHIVADKLNGLDFSFKSEYWNKMQQELDANCAQTNTCASNTIGGFISGSLITTFVAVISIIVFFPWAMNNNPVDTQNEMYKDTAIEVVAPVIPAKNINIADNNTQEKTSIKPTETKSTKAIIKSNKKHKKAKAKIRIVKTEKKEAVVKQTIAAEPIVENNNQETKPTIDSVAVDQKTTTDPFEKNNIDTTKPIQKDAAVLETDSIFIPDGKILGNDKEKVEKETKVEVNSGPKPVKHVKTKSKPIKRVFKRRKGILYKMGIRK